MAPPRTAPIHTTPPPRRARAARAAAVLVVLLCLAPPASAATPEPPAPGILWWGSGNPAHCNAQAAADAAAAAAAAAAGNNTGTDVVGLGLGHGLGHGLEKVAIDVDGFAVCGPVGSARCDDLEKTPANTTCEGAVPAMLDRFGALYPIESTVAIWSIVVNTATCVGVFLSGTDIEARQTVWLVAFQATTDFAFSWLCTPVFLHTVFSRRWEGGQDACDATGFGVHIFGSATIFSLAILTWVRYRTIVTGTYYHDYAQIVLGLGC